jgi:sarcosine oxidase
MAVLDAEVAVVGVGTMGSMALWQLARRGVPAIGFERYNPGHDRSGAGGESRLFRTAYHEGSHYVPLLRHARTLWRELEAESGHPLLTLNGGLMIGGADSAFLTSVRRSVTDHGIDHEVLDRDGMARRYPQHPLRDGELAVLDRESGFLRPELAVTVAADAAERRGATVVRHRRVTRVEPDGDGVTVLAGGGRWRVRTAIVAAGAWTNALLPGHTPRLDVQRLIMTWFPARDPARFAVDAFPIFLRQTGPYDISGWPSLDGATVKVAINHGWDRVADPDRLDRTVADELTALIRDAVAELLPDVWPEPCRLGVYLDGYTADHDALVGRVPGLDRVVVLGGFSGHGFKMSPAIGQAAAELATDGATGLPVGHLDPARFPAVPTVADRLERTVHSGC